MLAAIVPNLRSKGYKEGRKGSSVKQWLLTSGLRFWEYRPQASVWLCMGGTLEVIHLGEPMTSSQQLPTPYELRSPRRRGRPDFIRADQGQNKKVILQEATSQVNSKKRPHIGGAARVVSTKNHGSDLSQTGGFRSQQKRFFIIVRSRWSISKWCGECAF